ncbi:MAG: zinc-binding alcohol dehydrogenase family protein [Saprospiraceae bacterium]|nr:zinc-binding alcohol dehydrogenase family protein [Saprospiraceae bacterium]
MRQIICREPGRFEAVQVDDIAEVGAHQVKVDIRRIGICGTDLHAFAGNQAFFTYPRVLGHELAGEVSQVGTSVRDIRPGDRVLIMPYVSCGTCIACRHGKTNCCTSIQVLGVHTDGGMQDQIVVDRTLLLALNDLPFEAIAIVEPLAIGAHALRRSGEMVSKTVVVIGCGPIGVGIIAQAQERGARVIAMDVVPDRLEFVSRHFNVSAVVDARSEPLQELVSLTNGDLADVVIDATGNKLAMQRGHEYMSHGGQYILVGLYNGELGFIHPKLHAKETSLLCSRNATRQDFVAVVEYLRTGHFPVSDFITHATPFDAMIGEFPKWIDPNHGVMKAMVVLE